MERVGGDGCGIIMDALEEAIQQYAFAIMNTEQGSQYTSKRFIQAHKGRGI